MSLGRTEQEEGWLLNLIQDSSHFKIVEMITMKIIKITSCVKIH